MLDLLWSIWTTFDILGIRLFLGHLAVRRVRIHPGRDFGRVRNASVWSEPPSRDHLHAKSVQRLTHVLQEDGPRWPDLRQVVPVECYTRRGWFESEGLHWWVSEIRGRWSRRHFSCLQMWCLCPRRRLFLHGVSLERPSSFKEKPLNMQYMSMLPSSVCVRK